MRKLKIRQIRQLGVDAEIPEAFFCYCQGGQISSKEEIKALDSFLALLDKHNEQTQFYNAEKLRKSFQAIIMGVVAIQPKVGQKELTESCHYINKRDLLVRKLKQTIKNILGRN